MQQSWLGSKLSLAHTLHTRAECESKRRKCTAGSCQFLGGWLAGSTLLASGAGCTKGTPCTWQLALFLGVCTVHHLSPSLATLLTQQSSHELERLGSEVSPGRVCDVSHPRTGPRAC
jgi:hypothetical protein